MSKRKKFSSETMEHLIKGTDWSTDVPLGFQGRIFHGATPAQEGTGKGRGAIVFDIHREAEIGGFLVEQAAGFKIERRKARCSTAITITTGNRHPHVSSVVEAAKRGDEIRNIVLTYLENEAQWYAVVIDLGALIERYGIEERDGKGHPVTIGVKCQRYQRANGTVKEYEYAQLCVNVKAAGLTWEPINLATWDWESKVGTFY